MSIAVSAIVQPSRWLSSLVGAMSSIVLAGGVAIAAGLVVDLSPLLRWSLASSIVFLSFFGFYHGTRSQKPIQLSISGTGQIWLTEVDSFRPCREQEWPHVDLYGEAFVLMSDSTLFAYALLLRLQAESGRIITVPVLPDSVSRDTFRALSAACRWIATQNKPSGPERK
ncbi:protein YgfX [Noviherbaspirillum sp. Root189]|uniref:protein YgfX n=1 Tax=Noviherbaspirillum sp. Root189 TaxID=1736487 RepID=UPI0026A00ABE